MPLQIVGGDVAKPAKRHVVIGSLARHCKRLQAIIQESLQGGAARLRVSSQSIAL